MPHRDPQTGQFVDGEKHCADRTEEVRFNQNITVTAAATGGGVGPAFGQEGHFEGVNLYDLGEIIERDELAYMTGAYHRMIAYTTSTSTEDGTVRGAVEVSTSPERTSMIDGVDVGTAIEDFDGDFASIERDFVSADTDVDTVGPTLVAVGYSPFYNASNGAGGDGTAGTDEWEGVPSAEGNMDARDDFYLNGTIEASNVDDAAIHVDIVGWHQWGVEEDALDRPVRC